MKWLLLVCSASCAGAASLPPYGLLSDAVCVVVAVFAFGLFINDCTTERRP